MSRAHAMLEERARRLARPADTVSPVALISVLVCAAGAELYGVEIGAVSRVAPYLRPSFLPSQDPALLGLIASAGRFYRVFDAARLLGLAPAAGNHVLMLRAQPIALRFDGVLGVAEVALLGEEESSRMRATHNAVRGFSRAPTGAFADRAISLLDPNLLRLSQDGAAERGET